jgi:hypothetical protein
VSVYENYVEITGHEGEPVRVEGTVSYEGSDWTVVSVGESAFRGCGLLETVDLPSAVSVGVGAFYGCNSLQHIIFSDSLGSVGENAFTVHFYSGDAKLGCDAEFLRGREFVGAGDRRLYEVFTADSIEYRVVDESNNFVKITGYEGEPVRVEGTVSYNGADWTVVSVEDNAFGDCGSLEVVGLPSAESVGDRAFFGCSNLETVDLSSAGSVGEGAFGGCEYLQHIIFSDSLGSVGRGAFNVNFYSGDAELELDAGSLRGREFVGNSEYDLKLYEVFTEDYVRYKVLSVSEVSAIGFEGSPESLDVPSSVAHNGKEYFPVSIAEHAFDGCATAKKVTIGDCVTEIGFNALGCPYLEEIEVGPDNMTFDSYEGVLYDQEGKTLLIFPKAKQTVVFSEGVAEIAAGAFFGAGAALKADSQDGKYFRYVKIPATVTKIGDYAFYSSALECLKFSGGTVSVGESAFAYCYSLTYAVFNAEFVSVADTAFDGCVFYDGGAEMAVGDAIAGHKFTGDGSGHLDLYVPPLRGTIVSGDVKYRITSNEGAMTVSAVRIADESATELVIPASISYLGFEWEVASIASKAFMGNGKLESVNIAADVGYRSFSGCSSLRSVELGGVSSIGSYAFSGCKALETVHNDGTLESIGTSAFSGCASLSDIDLRTVKSVGKHAFYCCSSLTKADLGRAESIGYGAFSGTDLQDIRFGALSYVDPKAFFRYAFYDGDGKIGATAEDLSLRHFTGGGKALSLEY